MSLENVLWVLRAVDIRRVLAAQRLEEAFVLGKLEAHSGRIVRVDDRAVRRPKLHPGGAVGDQRPLHKLVEPLVPRAGHRHFKVTRGDCRKDAARRMTDSLGNQGIDSV